MTPLLTTQQRTQLTKTMNMLGKLCPDHLGPYYCNEDCPYKAKYTCPAEMSIIIQYFLDATCDKEES